ncbi:hypothetical protein [Bacillus sp. UNC438CL73TsuS30]|uniref:hypothetical protein n=1 Tax=Bacillus sp. UNC438CL73TsuS30 TaxID=1340434 RepID=UPI0006893337|nr:hypothetical protein [Bacillus sp. UNC438CL73TsuS30]
MLNSTTKKEALKRLERLSKQYASLGKKVQESSIRLLEARQHSSELIKEIEQYINTLVNTPKEFEATFSEIKIYLDKFQSILDIKLYDEKIQKIAGGLAGAGVAMGAGVAAFGPTAAMAIATTFGTASTGTAIATLYGAAQTSAALAWLGGGALVAGGGGMLAGEALLALAGPIGWAIGGTALIGGAFFANKKNKEAAEKAQRETTKILKEIAVLNAADIEINELSELTIVHRDNLKSQLSHFQKLAPRNYNEFSKDQKYEIG